MNSNPEQARPGRSFRKVDFSTGFHKLNVKVQFSLKQTQDCPVCRRRSSRGDPPINLSLRNMSLLEKKNEEHSVGSEKICSLHHEKLNLFCLEDKRPVCLVCVCSEKHLKHTFKLASEAVASCKEELQQAAALLKWKIKSKGKVKGQFEETLQHIKLQAEQTELQIKQQFVELHEFLSEEEEAVLDALREEEEHKKQMMMEKMTEMDRQISALSLTVEEMEEVLRASDSCLLKEFSDQMERLQTPAPDPPFPSRALINVSGFLGNLQFRVWKKMKDFVRCSEPRPAPVILDPNTAPSSLTLSEDLTAMAYDLISTVLPNNAERFECYPCALGSEGFTSGKHSWVVEVDESCSWSLGVTTGSKPRKGRVFFSADFWSLQCGPFQLPGLAVAQKLERIRVDLDYDEGTVSFSDPVLDSHIHTFKTTFNESVFPFFCSPFALRILPCDDY
ncbi:hypothetical protein DNTS_022111 [Danionella cerebrum]|uniref:B30.2/SPRY domain-containing protein n=1 Tax=Danionella cerebrum TaxID=2873325 RepID=A0A553R0J4_9TELE|nr:hypothetical protein DNTS_022111 [Danionella translucida]